MTQTFFEKIKTDYILPFQKLGWKKYENGSAEYGHVPQVGALAYLIKIIKPLNTKELQILQKELRRPIPKEYSLFLTQNSNGFHAFCSCFSLDGYIGKTLNRALDAPPQPFDIRNSNIYGRPKNSKDSYFYIGGYGNDGSQLYIDEITGKVHYCKRQDATSLYCWDSFEEMLTSEMKRLYQLFEEDLLFEKHGQFIGSSKRTLPL